MFFRCVAFRFFNSFVPLSLNVIPDFLLNTMPKKAAGKEPTTPRGSASKAKKSVEQSPAAASPKKAQPVVPSYYAERPTVASVRASLSNTSGPTQWFRDAYFRMFVSLFFCISTFARCLS
jgi:hypothetical protein